MSDSHRSQASHLTSARAKASQGINQPNEEEDMSTGQEHYERRRSQAAAAQKAKRKSKQDIDWKREEQ